MKKMLLLRIPIFEGIRRKWLFAMKNFIIGLFLVGLTTQLFAQNTNTEELPTVVLNNVNYKYLSDVNPALA